MVRMSENRAVMFFQLWRENLLQKSTVAIRIAAVRIQNTNSVDNYRSGNIRSPVY